MRRFSSTPCRKVELYICVADSLFDILFTGDFHPTFYPNLPHFAALVKHLMRLCVNIYPQVFSRTYSQVKNRGGN
jgi:hypothetical protein